MQVRRHRPRQLGNTLLPDRRGRKTAGLGRLSATDHGIGSLVLRRIRAILSQVQRTTHDLVSQASERIISPNDENTRKRAFVVVLPDIR